MDEGVAIALDELLARVGGLQRGEVVRWVERRWVLPDRRGDAWLFREIDVARVELIAELRVEHAIDDDALDLVLNLLDQIYGLRRQLRQLCGAVESQSDDIRDLVRVAYAIL